MESLDRDSSIVLAETAELPSPLRMDHEPPPRHALQRLPESIIVSLENPDQDSNILSGRGGQIEVSIENEEHTAYDLRPVEFDEVWNSEINQLSDEPGRGVHVAFPITDEVESISYPNPRQFRRPRFNEDWRSEINMPNFRFEVIGAPAGIVYRIINEECHTPLPVLSIATSPAATPTE